MRIPFRSVSLVTLLLATASWWGCGDSIITATTSSTASGGQGGTSATTSSTTTTSSTSSLTTTSSTSTTSTTSVCAPLQTTAQAVQLDMLVLLNRSGSMDDGVKWPGAKAALEGFFQDPLSAGMGAGLTYFPNENADDCIWTDYALPNVPVAALPGNAAALVGSLDAIVPLGATPTWGAVKGTLRAATQRKDANPTHDVVVLLLTDGDPTTCAVTDPAAIADLILAARSYNGVRTFTVTLPGASANILDLFAIAGGTGAAYDASGGVPQIPSALAAIRSTATSCEHLLPPPPAGQVLDPGKVNVEYTPSGSTTPIGLTHVGGAGSCGADASWYYDSNTNPKRVEMCPAACTALQASPGAVVTVGFGCPTI